MNAYKADPRWQAARTRLLTDDPTLTDSACFVARVLTAVELALYEWGTERPAQEVAARLAQWAANPSLLMPPAPDPARFPDPVAEAA